MLSRTLAYSNVDDLHVHGALRSQPVLAWDIQFIQFDSVQHTWVGAPLPLAAAVDAIPRSTWMHKDRWSGNRFPPGAAAYAGCALAGAATGDSALAVACFLRGTMSKICIGRLAKTST